jgi:hypothetical protein
MLAMVSPTLNTRLRAEPVRTVNLTQSLCETVDPSFESVPPSADRCGETVQPFLSDVPVHYLRRRAVGSDVGSCDGICNEGGSHCE